MRIVVCLKFIAHVNGDSTHSGDGGRKPSIYTRQKAAYQLNSPDRQAIHAALELKNSSHAYVTAISMGPSGCKAALQEVMGHGIDEAVLLSDPSFAGSDTLATSLALARAVEKLGGCDLILTGSHSTDSDTGQVGPGIGEYLGIPHAINVTQVEHFSTDEVQFHRRYDAGVTIRQSCLLPAVLSMSGLGSASDLKPLTIAAKLSGRTKEIRVWSCQDLDLAPQTVGLSGSATEVVSVYEQYSVRKGILLESDEYHRLLDPIISKVSEVRSR
ncbi:electron transfer flavoprotein subunit beta/FixA family protein [Paenibacillus sp. CN-4]|uniref:electron transfer flavoprotein subunit beta/FixA family protein n=1 Tax=Paenibacillus nanchangensis TaxID=3348343 RepID=UPI00397CF6F3